MISTSVLAAPSTQAVESTAASPRGFPAFLQLLLENVLASAVDEVICVADGPTAARSDIQRADRRLFWCITEAVHRMSASVAAGLWASHPQSDGVMVVTGETPPPEKELINALIVRFERGHAWIVAPRSQDQPPNPILFQRELYPELVQLRGDDSGFSLLQRYAESTEILDWPQERRSKKARRRTQARSKERV